MSPAPLRAIRAALFFPGLIAFHTAPVSAAAVCELHIWPAERFAARSVGLMAGGLVGGVADAAGHAEGNKKRTEALAGVLDGESQLAAIRARDAATALGLISYQIVAHSEVLDPKAAGAKIRHTASPSSCYAELIVMNIFFIKTAIYAPRLTVDFIFRKFGDKQKAISNYHNIAQTEVKIDNGRAAESIAAANQQFGDAFADDFGRFAYMAAAQPDWK